MMERCFGEGEVERLIHYLRYTDDPEDDEDRWLRIALDGKPWEEEEEIDLLKEERKKAREYPGESSFGSTRKEIFENARAHLLKCARCCEAYIKYIRDSSRRIASGMSDFMERMGKGIHGAGIFGNYYNWLIHFDALKLQDHEELTDRMMDLVKMVDWDREEQ